MRVISSKEYARNVDDVICESLSNALYSAFDEIMCEYGMGYDERQVNAMKMLVAADFGLISKWRDQVVELFEQYGMNIRPDEKEW